MAASFAFPVSSISVSAARDLVRISPLAAQTNPLLPPASRFTIESVLVTADAVSVQLPVGLYLASDTGTGTDVTSSVVDLESGGALFLGTAAKDLSVAATKVTKLDFRAQPLDFGYEYSADDLGCITVMPGSHFIVRLDAAPAAPPLILSVRIMVKQW